jgi:uncharacterized membrane protein required for colicin V production
MEFILDIIFIAIAIALIILGAKKGLVKALLDGLSTIISGVIAYILATPVAKFIYDAFVRSIVKGELEKGLNESGTDFGSISESVNALVAELPEGAVLLASKFGFNVNDAISNVMNSAPDSNESLIETLMTNIGDNVFLTITEAITMVALFVVVSILLTFVIRLFDKVVKKIPVVKQTNKLAGGFLGLIKAVVIIFVLSTVLFFIAGSSSNEELVAIVNSSKIFEFVNNNNPLLNIFN